MHTGYRQRLFSGWLACVTGMLLFAVGGVSRSQDVAAAGMLLDAAGIEGGLVVHLGCGKGELTSEFGADGRYVVQGLSTTPEDVVAARKAIQADGRYGRVTVSVLESSRLPYVDELVNVLVVEHDGGVPPSEFMRVLAPGGRVLVGDGVAAAPSDAAARSVSLNGWSMFQKPWPEEADDWSHALYDASNNAVNADCLVGPPRHMRWLSGPAWSRSHDHLASVSVAVSSSGRLFTIVDEGPTAAVVLPARWFLVARDAFNGIELWRRPVGPWEHHLRGFRSGPPELSRTVVADDDRVYATLGYGKPVVAMDASTGRTIRQYEATENALEIIVCDGVLYVVTGERPPTEDGPEMEPWARGVTKRVHGKKVMAVDADSGSVLWQRSDEEVTEVMPLCLCTDGSRVFLQNPDAVVCLDASTGTHLWRSSRPVSTIRRGWSTPTLVVYEDIVFSADRAAVERSKDGGSQVVWSPSSAGGNAPMGELIAFSAETGERLWSAPCQEGYNSPVDVLVADGLVWSGQLVRAKQPGITVGRDPRTGEVKRERPPDKEFFTVGMGHHRCYRNRGTGRYLVLGRAGVEFVDLTSGRATADHWVRGVCQYGVLPCNGLLYAPPHSCACYIEGKLNGYWALAPNRSDSPEESRATVPRLRQGPAYHDDLVEAGGRPEDWPTYRRDATRSGWSRTVVPERLVRAWRHELGGRLSSPVVAHGVLYVTQIDRHTVHALDAATGTSRWRFTAGGRVDSPPTVYRGRVFFGCADGWVYSLRAADGALAWRFRAAPEDRRALATGQLESAWPVHGSVLVQEDSVYVVAGRSSFVDGGLHWYRLDAASGRAQAQTRLHGLDQETGLQPRSIVRGTHMSACLPDVLSSNGASIFIRHTRMNKDGQQLPEDVPHLYSPNGFLDDSWWHRTYWMVGASMGSGYGGWPRSATRVPAGRMLVLGKKQVYGFGRSLYVHYGSHVGLDSASVYHYRPRDGSAPRWTYSRLFSAPYPESGASRRRPRRVTCVGVEQSESLDPTGKALTVTAWAKPKKADGVVVARGAYVHGYALYLQEGRPHLAIRGNKKYSVVAAKDPLPSGWTHLTGVLTEDKTLELYVNGELAGTAQAFGLLPADPGELMEVGADASNNVGEYTSPFPFTGLLDEVRVYHRALTVDQVRSVAAAADDGVSDPALVLRFSFDDGDARDDSGHGNDGTLEGVEPVPGRIGQAMSFPGKGTRSEFAVSPVSWELNVPVVVRAMVLTGDDENTGEATLFVAGAGTFRVIDTEAPGDSLIRREWVEPFEAIDGDRGGTLWALSPDDGTLLATHELGEMPVFDGMIAANRRLYIATASGAVLCLGDASQVSRDARE